MRRFKYIIEYLFLFVLNGIMLWFFRGYLNLVIAAAMILFLLYAVISVHIVKRYVSLSLQVPAEYMTKNTRFLVKIMLTNRCYLPLVACLVRMRTGNVFLEEAKEHDLVIPVKMHDTTVVEYPLRASCVGNVEILAEELVLSDLLSLHTVSVKLDVRQNVFIIPAGTYEQEFALNAFEKGMDEAEESKLRGSDFSDVSHVREYIPGDAIKNIHWKLSAKKDAWMVKERLQMSSRKLLVVLRLDKSSNEAADLTVETLYSFGIFFLRNRVPVTLFWWSEKYHETRQQTAESEDEWLQLMIHIFSTKAGSGFVEEHFRSLNPGKGYILCDEDGLTEKS